jgi:hypothetical protein
MFSSVLVISDRNVIDAQLRDTIESFERQQGVVVSIAGLDNSKSGELTQALIDNKKIVVCTIQTFPFAMQEVRRLAATAMHVALIGLTVALPLSGLFDRWARGRTVTVFGGVALPAPASVPGGGAWGEVHEALAGVLVAVVAAHVLAALWHQFVLRDGALSRMIRAA